MNRKINGLSRQVVYSFLIGLIVGGIIIGWVDANAKTPLFSNAFLSSPNTDYGCSDENSTAYCGPLGGGLSGTETCVTIDGETECGPGSRMGNTNSPSNTNSSMPTNSSKSRTR